MRQADRAKARRRSVRQADRAKARRRSELLEAFVAEFDAMIAAGMLNNRVNTTETRHRFEASRDRLSQARARLAAEG